MGPFVGSKRLVNNLNFCVNGGQDSIEAFDADSAFRIVRGSILIPIRPNNSFAIPEQVNPRLILPVVG